MKLFQLFICLQVMIFGLTGINPVQAQEGDQILDGIGETGLVARYVFDGNSRDWSRNNLHGNTVGQKATFVTDEQFGKVLSLPGDGSAHVSLPGDALKGLESVSVTGWIYLRSDKPGQRIFDFTMDPETEFFAAPVGTMDQEGFQILIATDSSDKRRISSPAIDANKWVHFAVVMDVPSQSLTTFINGKEMAQAKDVEIDLNEVFENEDNKENLLLIGKSRVPGTPNLNAKLHDLRIYRIPLNSQQIAGIHGNALGEDGADEISIAEREDRLEEFDSTQAQLYNKFLERIPDVKVETVVGYLPRLPRYVDGVYRDQVDGPKVRVLWAAPTDNSEVLEPGSYTVVGRIAGTDFTPKAIVTVKAGEKSETPDRQLETFDLHQVALNQNANGNNTKFIENRDKFINVRP